MKRWVYFTVAPAAALAAAPAAFGKVLLSQEEALKLAFPAGTDVERRTAFLTQAQRKEIERLGGGAASALTIFYRGTRDGQPAGTALFDTHIVRTQPETIMVLVDPSGAIARIEVLSFTEPEDYLPTPNWYRQFAGKTLDEELFVNRGVRAVTGATLTVRATVEAARRLLATCRVIEKSPHVGATHW